MALFGIFGKKKKKSDNVSFIPDAGLTKQQAKNQVSIAKKQMDALENVYNNYKKTKDVKKCIHEYEKLLNGKYEWDAINYEIKLAELYRKNKDFDKAWSFLHKISIEKMKNPSYAHDIGRIRFELGNVLRDEGKYKGAIEQYILGYYVLNHESGSVNIDSFKKMMSSSAKGLKLTEQQINGIADILEKSVKNPRSTENALIKDYRNYL